MSRQRATFLSVLGEQPDSVNPTQAEGLLSANSSVCARAGPGLRLPGLSSGLGVGLAVE